MADPVVPLNAEEFSVESPFDSETIAAAFTILRHDGFSIVRTADLAVRQPAATEDEVAALARHVNGFDRARFMFRLARFARGQAEYDDMLAILDDETARADVERTAPLDTYLRTEAERIVSNGPDWASYYAFDVLRRALSESPVSASPRCLCGGPWPCPDVNAPGYRLEAYAEHGPAAAPEPDSGETPA